MSQVFPFPKMRDLEEQRSYVALPIKHLEEALQLIPISNLLAS